METRGINFETRGISRKTRNFMETRGMSGKSRGISWNVRYSRGISWNATYTIPTPASEPNVHRLDHDERGRILFASPRRSTKVASHPDEDERGGIVYPPPSHQGMQITNDMRCCRHYRQSLWSVRGRYGDQFNIFWEILNVGNSVLKTQAIRLQRYLMMKTVC